MKYKIAGADISTGKEHVVTLDAATAHEAEGLAREQGLLISSIDELDIAGERSAMIDYRRSDVDHAVPDYSGLKFGAIALRIIAGVCFLIGGFVLILGVVSTGSLRGYSLPGILSFVISFLTSLWPFVSGTIFYACASACDALRDIARNTCRLRDQRL